MDLRSTFISIIVPVFNEENRVEAGFPSLFSYLENNFEKWEVIYVDDGSTDRTYTKLELAAQKYPGLRLLRIPTNTGKGNAVRQAFQVSEGDLIIFSDADFSTPIEEIETLFSYIDKGFDIAIGSRSLDESNVEIRQAWLRQSLGKVFNLIIRILLPIRFQDTQCGFKMFKKEAVRMLLPQMKVNGFAFDVETLVIAQILGMKIAEVPVTWRNVLGSKVHPVKSSLEMLKDTITIRFRVAKGSYR